MDAMTLRIVLLVLGCVFLAGIYLYETNRRKRDSAQAHRRRVEMLNSAHEAAPAEMAVEQVAHPDEQAAIDSPEGDDTWIDWDEEDTELLNQKVDEIGTMQAEEDDGPELELAADSESASPDPEQQDLFGFSAQEESPVDVPVLIIQINLRARSEPFTGPAIQKAMQDTGLILGDLSIYHRIATDGSNPQLNVASMVEPGVFPKQDVDDFSTPGLTLFTQLPGPGDSMAIFADMLFTAERLAAILDGELQDETHSALTKQTIEHMRGEIMEHRRQVQLARSKG
ncbi:MAG: cell division protein ZipA [Candidatus Thiodiazotropha sp.]